METGLEELFRWTAMDTWRIRPLPFRLWCLASIRIFWGASSCISWRSVCNVVAAVSPARVAASIPAGLMSNQENQLPDEARDLPWAFIWGIGLCVGTLVLYGRVVGFDVFLSWDDLVFAFDRPELKDWWSANWRQRLLTPTIGYPLPFPTAVHATIHGLLPESWIVPVMHGVSLAFHLANVLLVHQLARKWQESETVAGVSAAIWAAHPILVESVAWVTNLKTVMAAFGAMAAILAWERHLSGSGWRWGLCAVACVIFSLGCRPEAVVWPFFFALRTWSDPREHLRDGRHVIWLTAGVLVVLVYLPISVFGHRDVLDDHGMAPVMEGGYLWMERVSRMLGAIGLQAQNLLWPDDLTPIPYPGDASYGTWLERRVPSAMGLLVWAPASNIEYLPRFTADTYFYLPAAGIVIALMGGLEVGARAISNGVWKIAAAGGTVALLLGALTVVQVPFWTNTESLFSYTITQTPEAPKPYRILAHHFTNKKEYGKARVVYERSFDRLYATGMVPMDLFVAYEKTGGPQRALELGLRLYQEHYEWTRPDELHGYLVWLTIEYELDIPDDERRARVFRRLARRAIIDFGSDWTGGILESAVRHFLAQGEMGLARDYLAGALQLTPAACRLWRQLDETAVELPPRARPSRPTSCK